MPSDGCGTARAGPLISSGCGPTWVGVTVQAQAFDTPVDGATASLSRATELRAPNGPFLLEVGSSGQKRTTCRVVSGAPPTTLENPKDRVPSAPGRTHNRIKSLRLGTGVSVSNPSTAGALLELLPWRERSRHAGRGTDWERLLRGPSPGDEQSTQNCETTTKGTGLAESTGKEDPVEIDSSLTL
ncbi:hypothetical protein J1N35_022769 [Gossypium stocksii]|uniref:Uncharacterized protein n=1 Tax=Gossypium stocksii TaxID=47602 RepID=A0A9D3VHA0_9ROSI|nr:hypothetical protein J1N35_022769 [Gossypium stocksii]